MKLRRKENSNILLLRAYHSDEYTSWGDYAVLEITPELKKKIIYMKNALLLAKSRMEDIYELTAWDYDCQHIHGEDCDAEIYDAIEEMEVFDKGIVPVESFDTEAEGLELLGVDCMQVHVEEHGFKFEYFPKHVGSVYINTYTIPFDYLNKVKIPEKSAMESK